MISRRSLLAGICGAAACSRRKEPNDGKVHLTLSTWGEPVELHAFQSIIDRFQSINRNIVVTLEAISYKTRHDLDTLLAADLGPDLLRVQYQDVGRYSPSNALIDLTPYLPGNLGAEFTIPTWTAVNQNGRIHALPHHTDTSAILYNRDAFRKAGIRIPQNLADSWSWAEFVDIGRYFKRNGFPNGFAINWTMGGSFRWLNFLYQHGGTLLTPDFRHAAIPSKASIETLDWTRSLFTEGLVPRSDSAQSGEQVENLFATGVVPMYFDIGPQALRTLKVDFPWAATFLPHDEAAAAELGGNAVGITRVCRHPAAAAEFLQFLTNEENMRDFVLAAEFLPVRRSLQNADLKYPYRPDEMRVHQEQATVVPNQLARTVTLPEFDRIGLALGEELDLAFTGGQSTEETLARIAKAAERSL